MRNTADPGEHVNPEKTRTAVRHAVDDVQHAARPEKRSVPAILSWLVALSAGATVAYRSLRAAGAATADAPSVLESSDALELRGTRNDRAGAARDRDRRAGAGDVDGRGRKDRRAGGGLKDRSNAGECPAKVEGPGALLKELWCRFQSDECLTRSQALAFIGVLSLGPILLFALAALGFVIHDAGQVEQFVHGLVAHLLPGRQASEAANNLIAQTHILESAQTLMKGKWWAVAIGVISLIWAAVGLFVGASDPMNAAWNAHETRGFVKLRLICLGVFVAAGLLFMLSLVPSALPSLVGRLNLPMVGSLPPGTWWLEVVGWLLAIIVDSAMFTVIYKFLPNTPVSWKSALFGGVVAGILWEVFKKGFAVYIAHFGDYNKLYGALGGAVLLVTWIWYSCVLLLVGAIVCKMYREHAEEGGVIRTGAAESHHA